MTSKVNIGALKKCYVNIAVHGHLPVLVKEIVKAGQSEKFIKLALQGKVQFLYQFSASQADVYSNLL